jgi:hypothetical protein
MIEEKSIELTTAILRQAQHDKAQETAWVADWLIVVEEYYEYLKKFTTVQADTPSPGSG